jgi:hypothetical protein
VVVRGRFRPPTDRIYGKPSVRADENMKSIVEGRYNPCMNEEDRDYPDLGHMTAKVISQPSSAWSSGPVVCLCLISGPWKAVCRALVPSLRSASYVWPAALSEGSSCGS